MTGTLRCFRAEWHRLAHGRAALGVAAVLAVLAALRVLAARVAHELAHAEAVQAALSKSRPLPEASPLPTAYAPFLDGWLAGLAVGTLLLSILAARALAADLDAGLLRIGATRGVSRPGLVLGRVLLGVPVVAGVLSATALGSFLAAAALFDFGPVTEEGFELVSEPELRAEILLGTLATLPPLLATWCFGLLVSSVSRSGVGAVAGALTALLAFDLFKEVLGRSQFWVFAAFNPSFVDKSCLREVAGIARGFSDAGYSRELLAQNLWLPWPEAALCALVACLVLKRRAL